MSNAILVVEDEATLRSTLGRFLSRRGHRVLEARSKGEALELMQRESDLFLVLADIALPDGLGFELVQRAPKAGGCPKVILMTGDNNIDHAITAVRRGAIDFLLKPFSLEALEEALLRAQRERARSKTRDSLRPPAETQLWRRQFAPGVLGQHPSLTETFDLLASVADTDCTVLVTGETGTGKELVARALHRGSNRHAKPFVTVNCAAIPENLLESELFGHVKGAFTGATQARTGRFLQADGGTIFLDEIGELP
ncbi:MAG: sigma 54-interacting transcriptional regulator, partial [Proteobacteria bacterium]|nr:sigma 54-interacting transcriptional regulator [Pseudomonadota bacterium]